MNLNRCHNIAALRQQAKRKLPAPIFHYIDGGADDEVTLRRNTTAFDDIELSPRYLVNIEQTDTRTRILGQDVDLPLVLSPTGMSRLFHHESENTVATAAAKKNIFYSLSTLGTTSIEDVAKCPQGPRMFQVYMFRDRSLTEEFVERCRNSEFNALCLTIDMPVAGNRERDLETGMVLPPKFGLKSLASFAAHPHWSLRALLNHNFELANVAHRVDVLASNTMSLIEYVNRQFDPTVTWRDAAWLANLWEGPFVIKGVQTADDAIRAVDVGASAIMVSNHGGRQLDGSSAAVDCLPPIVEAVGVKIEIILDGGIRRGTHVIKAIAMGATACSIGRPYLYGLAAGGENGVNRVIDIFKSEIERSMALLGCQTISDISNKHIQRRHTGK